LGVHENQPIPANTYLISQSRLLLLTDPRLFLGLLICLVHEVYKKHASPGNVEYPNRTLDGFRAQQLTPETFYDLGLLVVASEIVYILELAN